MAIVFNTDDPGSNSQLIPTAEDSGAVFERFRTSFGTGNDTSENPAAGDAPGNLGPFVIIAVGVILFMAWIVRG